MDFNQVQEQLQGLYGRGSEAWRAMFDTMAKLQRSRKTSTISGIRSAVQVNTHLILNQGQIVDLWTELEALGLGKLNRKRLEITWVCAQADIGKWAKGARVTVEDHLKAHQGEESARMVEEILASQVGEYFPFGAAVYDYAHLSCVVLIALHEEAALDYVNTHPGTILVRFKDGKLRQ